MHPKQSLADLNALPAMIEDGDGFPSRLPKKFVWSTSGKKHVDYGPEEHFEGEAGTLCGTSTLGGGAQGAVQAVICKGQLLARKRMHARGLDEESKREVRILEGVVHRHIIQLAGSYTEKERLYILLHPVAEGNLKEFLKESEPARDVAWENVVKHTFGCLASAVAFLHSREVSIKHKDIKPTNVLISQGSPILTDFGLSNSFKGMEDSISSGRTGKTQLYAAPEIIEELPRGKSQDVFSLGLVFQDMYWALHGVTAGTARDASGNHRQEPYEGSSLTTHEREFKYNLMKMAFDWSPKLKEKEAFNTLIRVMTARERNDRPTARDVRYTLMRPSYFGRACGDCYHLMLEQYKAEVGEGNWNEWSFVMQQPQIPNLQPLSVLEDDMTRSAESNLIKELYFKHLEEDTKVQRSEPEEQLSDYEMILRDRGIHPRLATNLNWSGRGTHATYESDEIEKIPLKQEGILGYGNGGIIDSVQWGVARLARKSIRVPTHAARVHVKSLIQEIKNMANLEHAHVVQLVGSYYFNQTFHLLIYPVADITLRLFMHDYIDQGGFR